MSPAIAPASHADHPAVALHDPRLAAPVAARADVDADELTDDDLDHVVGGLARSWADALRTAPRPTF